MVLTKNNSSIQGRGSEMVQSKKFGMEMKQNRRSALSQINQNLVGTQPYPHLANKRGASLPPGANKLCGKNLPNPSHRPVTRRFAAITTSSTQEQSSAAAAQKVPTLEEKDQPVPMFLEQAEAVTDENHQMEVEMEDVDDDDDDDHQELIMDIDNNDVKNPLAVVDYVNDLHVYYKKMEGCSCVSDDYMKQQFDINERMRAILIDWLVEVHHKFELREETLFLTVNLIDRFLAQKTVVRKKLQLVGLVAMLLACKYEEVSVPVVDDFVFISDKAYTRKEVLEMEKLVLNTLQFNMSLPTPYVFMKRYLKAAESDKKLELLSFFLMELCLVEYEMLKFSPSFLAAAAVYTAQCTLYGFKQWNITCQWYTSYSEDQLMECSRLITSFHQKAATGRLTGVHRKYNTSKYAFTAKFEPATLV